PTPLTRTPLPHPPSLPPPPSLFPYTTLFRSHQVPAFHAADFLRPYVHQPAGCPPQCSDTDTKRNLCRSPKFSGHLSEFRRSAKIDRKSTRLNSSHGSISYAVFCLKKKNTKIV